MARRRKAPRSVPRGPLPAPAHTPDMKKFIAPCLAIILAAIPFGYGKYYELCTAGAFDGAMNIYSAQQIVAGGKLRVDVFPFASPATLLTNVVGVGLGGYSELGPKLIQMFMQLAALALMFYTLRKFYGAFAAVFAVVMAALFLSCPPYAKYGNVKEQFMIACMIVAACGVMLRHAGGSKLWLILSGALAANSYFYKQTGASVSMAMLVYLLAQPILRQRSWRDFLSDILLLLLGAFVGLIPLMAFYTWQGSLFYFIKKIPGIAFVIKWAQTGEATVAVGGRYVAGSRQVTTFAEQYRQVVMHYGSFVIPIGLALLAIGWRVVRLSRHMGAWWRRRRSGSGQASEPKAAVAKRGPSGAPDVAELAERFVLFLGLWWVLDMVFVWVSPRAYVEYFLPPNGSGAMLGAYALWRCSKQHIGWLVLAAVWLIIHVLIVCLKPLHVFPWLILGAPPEGHWGGFLGRLLALIIAVVIFLALRREMQWKLRGIVLTCMAAFVSLWWIGVIALPGGGSNTTKFKERVGRMIKSRRTGSITSWEYIGGWIKENSAPQDKIHVWGWVPGIYVAAERFSPAKMAVYSDMHTDWPYRLGELIEGMVGQLEADPPRYIVDSQKMHFPFNDHPVFDLWLYRRDQDGRVQFRPGRKDVLEAVNPRQNQWVEEQTYRLLTRPNRGGGAVPSEKARTQAGWERQRHEAMLPLREFVMLNYRPITLPMKSNMFVFEYKSR